jgi:hypothetical protein
MRRSKILARPLFAATLPLAVLLETHGFCQETGTPLRLVNSIPLSVEGSLDHMDADAARQKLFVAAPDHDSLEVVDLRAGRVDRSIPGFSKTQGVVYIAKFDKLFVTSGNDGTVKVFAGDTLQHVHTIKMALGPNRVAYDASTNRLFVVYGGKAANLDHGFIAIIDPESDRQIGDITNVPTDVGVRSGYFFVSQDRFYAGIPAGGVQPAQIWTFSALD